MGFDLLALLALDCSAKKSPFFGKLSFTVSEKIVFFFTFFLVLLLSDMEDESDKTQMAKEAFEISKYVLDQESERASKHESKAGVILGAVSFLIGAISLMARSYHTVFFPVDSFVEWSLLFHFVIALISFCFAWVFAFQVVKTRDYAKMSIVWEFPEEMTENLELFYNRYSEEIQGILSKNRETNKIKNTALQNSFTSLMVGFIFFCVGLAGALCIAIF